ncbi:MAG: phosphotransferase [Bacteroidota bacterium]|jgi:aminoglycoside/choline kinase family phosphotransferase|nr:phosphotransferase [Bacteroidota bacterium]
MNPVADVPVAELAAMHVAWCGEEVREVRPLKGDASDRRIFRLHSDRRTSIGVLGPNIPENRAFTGFARAFRAAGLAVPEILAINDHHSAYLEEDLGDMTLAAWGESRGEGNRPALLAMYERVLAELPRFQIDAADAVDYGLCYQWAEFGAEAMAFDIASFRTHFLERLTRADWPRDVYARDTQALIDILLRADRRSFLYRDFQSRNIMIREGGPWFIDFQSGRRGALHYDVAALLYDSRSSFDETERMRLVDRYCDRVDERRHVDRDEFLYYFHGFAILRLLQALGAFGNLGLNKGKPRYLTLIPSRLTALDGLLRHAEIMRALPALRSMLRALTDDPDALAIPTLSGADRTPSDDIT